MCESRQGYSPFQDPNVQSLAEALARFEALPSETSSRKARARSAVSTLSRLLDKRPVDIPAQPNVLMRHFPKFKHRPTVLSAKSIANCKSELRYLLDRTGAGTGRSWFGPLTSEWLAFRARFPDEQFHFPFVRLSRFMSFCSGQGIAPGQIDDAVIDRFRVALTDSDEVDQPEAKVRDVIRAWNKLAALAGPTLPALAVSPRRVPRWTIEPEKFPQEFQDDVARWLMCLSHIDPEAEEGPIRALRPASLASYRHQVFKAASALALSGHQPIDEITSLRSLLEIKAFQALMKFLRERQGGQPTKSLLGVAMTLKSIAKNWEKLGEEHLKPMRRLCENYDIDDNATTRTHERLKAFEDEKLLAKLLHLPAAILKEILEGKADGTTQVLAQVAIALEIEFQAPFRLKNLNTIRLGHSVQSITIGGQPRWIIRFPGGETKNHKQLVFEIPTDSVRFIERCLRLYEQPDGWLFPGERVGPKQKGLLSKQIKNAVEKRLGVPFHTHMLRGLGATLQVKERDGGFEHARAMLGDTNDRVIRQHYTSTAEQHLIRKAQETLQCVRVRTAAIAQAKNKRKVA